MLFPTIDFALFFAGSFALVWSLNNQNLLKKLVLLGLSLFFYASWDWHFVFLILASGAISFAGGLYVDAAQSRPFRRTALAVCVALDLGILVYFKYLNFLIAQILNFAHLLSLDPALSFPFLAFFTLLHSIAPLPIIVNAAVDTDTKKTCVIALSYAKMTPGKSRVGISL